MFEFFRRGVQIIAPIFVISTMLNVGLTQRLSDITGHLKNYPFVLNTRSQGSCDTPISIMSVTIRAAHRFDALYLGRGSSTRCPG